MNQNNFKHLFLLFYFLLFLCPSILSAQQSKITVTSFNRMENDITAVSQHRNGIKTEKYVR